jgi:hypothetical protein
LLAFQAANALPRTGDADAGTLDALRSMAGI